MANGRKLRKAHSRKCIACGGTGKSHSLYPPRACPSCLGSGLTYVSAERDHKAEREKHFADMNAALAEMFSCN